MNAIEIDLRAQNGRAADIAGDRDVDRRVVDRIRIEPFQFLFDAGDEAKIRRRLRGRRSSRLLPLGLSLLRAERLQLAPPLIESFLLPRRRVVGLAERRADVFGEIPDFGRDLLNGPAAGSGDENQYRN